MLTVICIVISLGILLVRKVEDWTWLFIGRVVQATLFCIILDFCVLMFGYIVLGVR